LFRGNAEAEIRKSLIERGYIKGIIGLPANLFYGTGIPACIIVMDKEGAVQTHGSASPQKGIFMVDASKGFIKDGNKNRLREQDIHKIVDIFNKQTELPKYSRLVSVQEISDPKNDFNLNIPRYIDSQEAEDIQDIAAHLLGGIPNRDIDALQEYWDVYPSLKAVLFQPSIRPNYSALSIVNYQLSIMSHPEFVSFSAEMDALFADWKTRNTKTLKALTIGIKPKQTIFRISEDVLTTYTGKALMDKYDVYQHLMNYWNDVMQDDCYLIAVDGWKAELSIMKQTKSATVWDCDLVPKTLVIDRYFKTEAQGIASLEANKEAIATQLTELEEEHNTEDGYFADLDKVNKASVNGQLKIDNGQLKSMENGKLKIDNEELKFLKAKIAVCEQYLKLVEDQTEGNKKIKEAIADLDTKVIEKYGSVQTQGPASLSETQGPASLSETEIKQLVVDDKWMASIERSVKTEMERISQRLTQRIKELAERYETPLPKQTIEVAEFEEKVNAHLQKMGFVWS